MVEEAKKKKQYLSGWLNLSRCGRMPKIGLNDAGLTYNTLNKNQLLNSGLWQLSKTQDLGRYKFK